MCSKVFEELPPKKPYVFRGHGVISQVSAAVYRMEITRMSGGSYRMPLPLQDFVTPLLAEERTEASKRALSAFVCYPPCDPPTHVVSIYYTLTKTRKHVLLFWLPLNFCVAGRHTDSVAIACGRFASSLIDQPLSGNYSTKPNPALIVASRATRKVWLSILFTRYSWYLKND